MIVKIIYFLLVILSILLTDKQLFAYKSKTAQQKCQICTELIDNFIKVYYIYKYINNF